MNTLQQIESEIAEAEQKDLELTALSNSLPPNSEQNNHYLRESNKWTRRRYEAMQERQKLMSK